jgi:hypothetical protein
MSSSYFSELAAPCHAARGSCSHSTRLRVIKHVTAGSCTVACGSWSCTSCLLVMQHVASDHTARGYWSFSTRLLARSSYVDVQRLAPGHIPRSFCLSAWLLDIEYVVAGQAARGTRYHQCKVVTVGSSLPMLRQPGEEGGREEGHPHL